MAEVNFENIVVYLIGPFRALTGYGVRRNIHLAEAYAAHVLAAGFTVICTHTMTGGLQGILPDDVLLRRLRILLRRADVGLLMPGWRRSPGSLGEIKAAEEAGIPIFRSLNALCRWAKRKGGHDAAPA